MDEALFKRFEKITNELKEARILLHQCLYFMNNVPNNKYDTMLGDKNHYKLCSEVQKLLDKDYD